MIDDFLVKLFSHNIHNFTLSRPGFLPPLERVLLGFTHMFKSFIVRMHLRANLWLQMWGLHVDEKNMMWMDLSWRMKLTLMELYHIVEHHHK
jgi:hypothetical protein